jgi:hypothetical protein
MYIYYLQAKEKTRDVRRLAQAKIKKNTAIQDLHNLRYILICLQHAESVESE